MPRNLSKSKLLAYRQCPKRLWLEVHKPDLVQNSPAAEGRFKTGHQLNDIARRIYDPENTGALIDINTEGFPEALARSKNLLATSEPIFEAGFTAAGGLAFADIMMPVRSGAQKAWRMIEVKSATSVKDYHRDDAAIQSYIARQADVPLTAIAIAHIDSSFIYQGDGNYIGLITEQDISDEAFARADEVKTLLSDAHIAADARTEPAITTGSHCTDPFECGFLTYCRASETQPEFPVEWLPRLQKKEVKDFIETKSITDMRDVPDDYLTDLQRRVKHHTLSGQPYFDAEAAARELQQHGTPASFLDFEAVQMGIPVWKGTRPYQQIPFQFSLHRILPSGEITHAEFLDLSGHDPCRPFAEALAAACDNTDPVFVYNQAFEKTRIAELAARFPDLAGPLLAINERIVDLLPVARKHYYHPAQKGSWSIKAVLPTVAPELDYADLEGVKDGTMAIDAYLEAVNPQTQPVRKDDIGRQLLAYCKRDTYANYMLWKVLGSGLRVLLLTLMCLASTPVFAAGPISEKAGSPDLTAIKAKLKAKDFVAARNDLFRLLDRNDHADVLNLLGFSLRKTGDYTNALIYYQRALDKEPDHLGALEYLGELYVETKQPEKARANLAKLVKLCPKGCEEREDLEKAMRDAGMSLPAN